jgi:hypothetical protein
MSKRCPLIQTDKMLKISLNPSFAKRENEKENGT